MREDAGEFVILKHSDPTEAARAAAETAEGTSPEIFNPPSALRGWLSLDSRCLQIFAKLLWEGARTEPSGADLQK
jgi:hypothetical protein